MPEGIVFVLRTAIIAAVDGWVGGEKLTRIESLREVSMKLSGVELS